MKSQSDLKISRLANKKSSKCKVVKSLTPLINFKFYLDIEKHHVSLKIESRIKELGGSIEFFLTKDVTHFVTDKFLDRDNNVESPQPPPSPIGRRTSLSNYSETGSNASISNDSKAGGNKIKSRADAMLQRARRTTQTESERPSTHQIPRSPTQLAKKWGIRIWHTEITIKYLDKVYNAIKERYNGEFPPKSKDKLGNARVLKGNYVKIESFEKHYRPYYQLLKGRWPAIDLTPDGNSSNAFAYTNEYDTKLEENLNASQQQPQQQRNLPPDSKKSQGSKMTRKNRSKLIRVQPTSRLSSEKQCGFCEICRVEYDVLTTHLKTDEHLNFVKNDGNFIELDTLIKSSANVDKFLTINKTLFNGNDCEVLPKRSRRNIAAANRLLNNSYPDVEPIKERVKPLQRKSLSEASSFLQNRNTRKSISQAAIKLSPPPANSNLTNDKRGGGGIGAVGRARRESIRKINYAEPGEEDEEITDDAIFQVQRRRNMSTTKMAPPPLPPQPRTSPIKIKEEPDAKSKAPVSILYKVVDSKTDQPNRRQLSATHHNLQQPSPLIVKFRKVRQTELSILNGEAVNFMFPPKMSSEPTDNERHTSSQTRTQSSDLISSEINSTPKRKSTVVQIQGGGGGDDGHASSADESSESCKRKKLINSGFAGFPDELREDVKPDIKRIRKTGQQCKRRFRRAPIQPRGRPKLKREPSDANCDIVAAGTATAAISPPEDGMGEKGDICNFEDILKNQLGQYKFAFERVPRSEPWFTVYNRQDECKERTFEYYGSTVYRKLPYEMGPFPWLPENCGCHHQAASAGTSKSEPCSSANLVSEEPKESTAAPPPTSTRLPPKVRKESPKKMKPKKKKLIAATKLLNADMPRKSPRDHPSTLAILSCLINRRDRDRDRDEKPPLLLPVSPPLLPTSPPLLPTSPPLSPRRKSEPSQSEPTKTASEADAAPTKPQHINSIQISPQIGENVKRRRRGEKLQESRKLKTELPDECCRNGPNTRPGSGNRRHIHFGNRLRKPLDATTRKKPSLPPAAQKDEKYVNVNSLTNEIDLYLSTPPSDLDFREDEKPPIPPARFKNEIVDDFKFEPNIGDLVLSESQFNNVNNMGANQMNKSVAHKLRLYKIFAINKKVKVNRTGWPKKRRVVTRQQQINGMMPNLNGIISVDLSNTLRNKSTKEISISTQSPITPPETDTEEKPTDDRNSVAALRDENTNLTFGSDRADNNSDMFTVSSDSLDTVLDVGHQLKTEIQKEILANRKCKVKISTKLPYVQVRKSCRQEFRKVKSPLAMRNHNIKIEKPDTEDETLLITNSPTPPSSSSADITPTTKGQVPTATINGPLSPRRLRKPRGRWYRER